MPWESAQEIEWDGGAEGMQDVWPDERIDAIERGDDPAEEELLEWGKANIRRGFDYEDLAHYFTILPLTLPSGIEGIVLLDDRPVDLLGQFECV